MTRQLYEAKEKFETESKRRWQPGILGAERRQSILDHLTCEVDGIVETTSLRIQLRQAEKRPDPIDNFLVVGAHEITGQTVLYKGTRGFKPSLKHASRLGRLEDSGSDNLITSITRCGWLGKMPVMYKTYSSRTGDGASKAAEEELKCLSRCLHPNVATVIGITKGYSGLNGYVVTASGIPIRQFMSGVDRGAPFVTFMRGVLEVLGLDLTTALGVDPMGRHNVHITVQPNGHPTVCPILDENDMSSSVDLRDRPRVFEAFSATMNPAARLAVDVCWETYGTGTSPTREFLDSVAALGWKSFTPLEVARLAAECGMAPLEGLQFLDGFSGAKPPLFMNEDIERSRTRDPPKIYWEPIEAGQTLVYHVEGGNGRPVRTLGVNMVEGAQWVSVPLCNSRTNLVRWGNPIRGPLSYEQARQARITMRKRGPKPKDVLYGLSKTYIVRIRPIEVVPEPVYFHCNLSSCSDLRGFWGFLSTSADPRSNTARLKGMEQMIDYMVAARTVRLTDMWDYKYRQMAKLSLASVPGGYPGSHVEDSTDDEDD